MARGSELGARGPDGWHADQSWGPADLSWPADRVGGLRDTRIGALSVSGRVALSLSVSGPGALSLPAVFSMAKRSDDLRNRPSMALTSMGLAFAAYSVCFSKHACTIEILLIIKCC